VAVSVAMAWLAKRPTKERPKVRTEVNFIVVYGGLCWYIRKRLVSQGQLRREVK
jgi:hypothetical protein